MMDGLVEKLLRVVGVERKNFGPMLPLQGREGRPNSHGGGCCCF